MAPGRQAAGAPRGPGLQPATARPATMPAMAGDPPLIVGIGGSTRAGSTSERLLRVCLERAEQLGARTQAFNGPDLRLPLYEADGSSGEGAATALVEALRRADGLVIASPGYHGSISGLIKNALDYVEDLRGDARPYLDGRAVGCIACAAGWQAAGSTLQALRAVVHALRGWPTPLGLAINSELPLWDGDAVADPGLRSQLGIVTEQVLGFARRWKEN